MKRAWLGCVGVALTLITATGRADEVEWRAVPTAKPAVAESPPPTAAAPAPVFTSRPTMTIKLAAMDEVVAFQPDSPRSEPLGQPRKERENPIPGPGCWGSGSSANNAGGKSDFIPTYNLVGEHGLGEEAPPVDPGARIWVRGEFLMWFMRPQSAPPLITTVLPTPPPPFVGNTGVIGQNNTVVLLGNGPIADSFIPGARFSAGVWLNCEQTCGLEARYLFLGPLFERSRFDSTPGMPILARPIFAPNTFNGSVIGETTQEVAFPPGFVFPPGTTFSGQPAPALSGTVTVDTYSFLWGGEVNAREALWVSGGCNCGRRIDVFTGFRYLDLQESLRIREDILLMTPDVQSNLPAGTKIRVVDFFGTHNQFYGGQLGVSGEWRRGRWFADVRAQVGLGVTHQTLNIDGFQVVMQPGGNPVVFNGGGLLAIQGANAGHNEHDRFSVVPEASLNIGYQLRPRLRAFLGYDFLYWNNVIRPGSEIDRVVDVTLVPNFVPPALQGQIVPVNPPRPAVQFRQTDFWAQGLNFGIERKW